MDASHVENKGESGGFTVGVDLQPRRFYAQRVMSFDELGLRRDRVTEIKEAVTEELALRVRLEVLATVPEVIERRWPTTWWDAVKERWFPRWAKRRWPPRFTSLRIERYAIYPQLEVPGRGPIVCIPRLDLSEYTALGPEA